jgi:hypothetical protein
MEVEAEDVEEQAAATEEAQAAVTEERKSGVTQSQHAHVAPMPVAVVEASDITEVPTWFTLPLSVVRATPMQRQSEVSRDWELGDANVYEVDKV